MTLNANGSFTYTPTAGYSGVDAFSYRASDGLTTSTAVAVGLTITPAPPADTTAPVVNMTAPGAGTVSGTVTVTATATDAVGVAGVQFLLNGSPLGSEDTTSPFSVAWNSGERRQWRTLPALGTSQGRRGQRRDVVDRLRHRQQHRRHRPRGRLQLQRRHGDDARRPERPGTHRHDFWRDVVDTGQVRERAVV